MASKRAKTGHSERDMLMALHLATETAIQKTKGKLASHVKQSTNLIRGGMPVTPFLEGFLWALTSVNSNCELYSFEPGGKSVIMRYCFRQAGIIAKCARHLIPTVRQWGWCACCTGGTTTSAARPVRH